MNDSPRDLPPAHKGPLDVASEAYRLAVDDEQGPVYTHISGAAGKHNVIILAVPFDRVSELGEEVRCLLNIAIADMQEAQMKREGR
jgi:predicted dinucleotide-binding enzyme